MRIEKDNALINDNAMLIKNSEDHINCCPFCGASENFFTDKAVEFNMGKLSNSEIKILDHAMKLEVFNGDFYKEAAKKAIDKEIKEMFKALASIEFMHANIHRRLGGFEQLPKLKKIDYSSYDNDMLLLNLAGKREEHAVAYYNKYIDEIENKNIIPIFKVLSEVENQHIKLLKQPV